MASSFIEKLKKRKEAYESEEMKTGTKEGVEKAQKAAEEFRKKQEESGNKGSGYGK